MRAFSQGASFRVTLTSQEVIQFNYTWPGSTLYGPMSFVFDSRNGDLIDGPEWSTDDPAFHAIMETAKEYGIARLRRTKP